MRREEAERLRVERVDAERRHKQQSHDDGLARSLSRKAEHQRELADCVRDRAAGAQDRKVRSDDQKRLHLEQQREHRDKHVRQLLPYGMRRWDTAAKYTRVAPNDVSVAERLGPGYLGPSLSCAGTAAAAADHGMHITRSSTNVQGRVHGTSSGLTYLYSRGAC